VKHHIVVEKTDNSARAADRCASLELCARPVSHLLAAHHPRVHVDGEDHEDLELAGTSERRFGWVARVDEGRKLYEAAAFLLSVGETRFEVLTEQR
jgi:hypothetical protein